MKLAALDIGTNTVLLLIVELRGSELQPLVERATITRLGKGVDASGRLAPEAVERTLACLREYARIIDDVGVDGIAAVGTSAVRDAEHGAPFLDEAERILGTRPRVIDGLEEADLAFRGALSGLPKPDRALVFDVGGGSTEVIRGQCAPEPVVESAVSLAIGSVRLHERHLRSDPPAASEIAAVRRDIEAALASAPAPGGLPIIGVAGTVTTLAAIELGLSEYDPSRVHGRILRRDAVRALAGRLATLPLAERRQLPGLEPGRADVIVTGAEIVASVLEWSGQETLLVSDRGVRWGLVERLARGQQPPPVGA
ncbi:MAG TPA: Ppx/GppA phosphatase family protein [Polyangiaceae bacterium]|nr:Ppx/GppA phosphatase family protein [Polyangiaceae bacterium]